MNLRFDGYDVLGESASVRLRFVADDPGPNRESEVTVDVTDAELGAVTTQAQLRTLVIAKLQRRVRATGLATKLDPFIGQSVTIS